MLRESRRRQLQPSGKKCKALIDDIKSRKYRCTFLTSEWAEVELIQAIRDRAIAKSFMLDGNEMAKFNRLKPRYRIEDVQRRKVIHNAIDDFKRFLKKNGIEIVKLNMDIHRIHDYCLKYLLETQDAAHVDTAIQYSCGYLVTIDGQLVESKISEIQVVYPDTLFSKSELRIPKSIS
jgi:predicted nucleic acid-binding protein